MFFKRNEKNDDVIKRKSYYGFSRNYPGKIGTNNYVIGESRVVRKRESIRRILIAVILVLIFAATFVITSICLNISEKPIEKTAVTTEAVSETVSNSKK